MPGPNESKPCLVNLGCGNRFHRDWINIDCVAHDPSVIACDLSRGIPLEDSTCDGVFQSHVLEHLKRPDALFFLRECRRVLRPGGILRVSVPDQEGICRAYLSTLEAALGGDSAAAANHEWMAVELIDQMAREKTGGATRDYLADRNIPNADFVVQRIGDEARDLIAALQNPPPTQPPAGLVSRLRRLARRMLDGLKSFPGCLLSARDRQALAVGRFRLSGEPHQWMYDRLTLKTLLEEAGFTGIAPCGPGDSSLPGWRDYHLERTPDGRVIKPDSLILEARKPAESASRA